MVRENSTRKKVERKNDLSTLKAVEDDGCIIVNGEIINSDRLSLQSNILMETRVDFAASKVEEYLAKALDSKLKDNKIEDLKKNIKIVVSVSQKRTMHLYMKAIVRVLKDQGFKASDNALVIVKDKSLSEIMKEHNPTFIFEDKTAYR